MKKFALIAASLLMLLGLVSCSGKYQTVKGDPLKTKIYTLDNGLKVYMSVNKEEPRIQTYIAVRVGGKNDPADNTGLAHYLEHIMFKGTEQVGTSDYASEKVYLDQIEELFNVYKGTTDPDQRTEIYHRIDSLSYLASQISIPNEYDKLMSVIGASGSNAFTSNDVTCYTENIPSNQIENWAKVQSDRFKNLVVRGFHTELEAVYEEFNMYLNDDQENAMIAIDSVLFKNHPYGKQTVIGTQEHLKNPSITAIKKQKATYYVPNNVAICLSGDFDPDNMIKIIEQYFGDWQPNPDIPKLTYSPEAPITSPVEKDVYGTEAEFVMISWRYPGDKDIFDSEPSTLVSEVLYNGQAGLIDMDVNQQQKTLMSAAMTYDRTDYGEFILMGYPKEGQTLEEVRDILLGEVAALRSGNFDDDLLDAVKANLKLQYMQSLERNQSRVSMFMNSFISGLEWKDYIQSFDRISKLTKEDVVAWAQKYLGENSYALAYKRQGVNPKSNKIEAPKITAIATNRDKQSDFLTEVQNTVVPPIEPVFLDFNKDISTFTLKDGVDVVYKKNETNDLAQLVFRFYKGLLSDPALSLAFNYLSYLGTPDRSAEEIAKEEYALACNHSFNVTSTYTSYSISGLSENIGKCLEIVEDLMANAVGDDDILEALKFDEIQARMVAKQTQSSCESALYNYIINGPQYVKDVTLTNGQVMSVTSDELLAKVKDFLGYAQEVLYYGPETETTVKEILDDVHVTADSPVKLERKYETMRRVTEPAVYVAPYDSRQFNYIQFSNRGEAFDKNEAGNIQLFNAYFGGGMNTVVFQEMREARALAYHASAYLSTPATLKDEYSFYAEIGSQNDKLVQAVEAFDEIINDMPVSEAGFNIAKSNIESTLRTQRSVGARALNSYLSARDLGLSEPLAKTVFESLGTLDINSLVATQQKWVKDRTYVYGILGDPADLDMNFLKTLGPVTNLTLEDIFGY
ncbi:MAG: insulinase family protein [Bacteroidales bacterium]|nr:insulinase family protein [Bacteroidales bacterium]